MPKVGNVAWSSCGGGFECGNVPVPIDYTHPNGDQINIALIKKPATSPGLRIGSLLVNPGGPGDSGITWLQQSISSFANVNKSFDLIGFDPRGVGLSSPIRCLDGPQLDTINAIDPVWDDPQEKQAGIDGDKSYVAGCQARNAKLLPFVDTASAARDMDLIREAVGDSKLTYLGLSYGTFLGQMYAHLFPTHVRALSLDGVVDPNRSAADMDYTQLVGFQSNLQAFLTDCAARKTGSNPCLFAATGDPGRKLTTLMARIDANPLRVGTRQLTRALAMNGVVTGLYDQGFWQDLDISLVLADRGDGRGLMAFSDIYYQRNADGTYSNAEDANNAINCLDHPVSKDLSFYDSLGPRYSSASPFLGPAFQYDWLICAYWPVKPTRQPGPLDAPGAPPILLVGGSNDSATPYVWAQAVHSELSNSVLLTRQGNGHTSYDSSACAHAAEDAYLINLTLPAEGTICN
jgi:pimeloyl-ACP methyl ester carboxylesterase